ncbi:hypothetical protein LI82_04170 [Methanococcoides methylutens]|uniref:Uncharacterized protein n=1 Tax=Methanococcoides methylutens TaxID=2226 RepID=A0A099T4Y6_METMT|nr:hypothetical protein [Methanococcoides methylutens]KGK99223.1 hypothetical protein LI82_04170 [Methanococcoides methylutens]
MISAKGNKNEHHFRHLVKVDHVSETPLHQDTKWLFYQKIKDCLDKNTSFPLVFECPDYGKEYTRIAYGIPESTSQKTKYSPHLRKNPFTEQREFTHNVVNGASRIEVEKAVDGFIPDLSLYDEAGNVVTAIEIVHKHEDSEEKSEYYLQNGIDVIYINVDNEDDLLDYHKGKYSKITFSLYRNGCNVHVLTTSRMLMENLHLREKIFQADLNAALYSLFSELDRCNERTVFEKIELKRRLARQKEDEIKRQQEQKRQIRLAEEQKRLKEERLLREEEQKRLRTEYQLRDEQRTTEIEAKKQKLLALGTKGICFDCGNEGHNISVIPVTEIDSRFEISIYRCAKCYSKYVFGKSDDKLKRAISEIVSN